VSLLTHSHHAHTHTHTCEHMHKTSQTQGRLECLSLPEPLADWHQLLLNPTSHPFFFLFSHLSPSFRNVLTRSSKGKMCSVCVCVCVPNQCHSHQAPNQPESVISSANLATFSSSDMSLEHRTWWTLHHHQHCLLQESNKARAQSFFTPAQVKWVL